MNVGEMKRDWKGDIYECNILRCSTREAFYNGPSENVSRTLTECEQFNFRQL